VNAAIDAGPVSNARISAAAVNAAVDAAVNATKEVGANAAAANANANAAAANANANATNTANSIMQNLNLVSAQPASNAQSVMNAQQPSALQGMRGRQGNPEEPDTGLEEVDMDSIPEQGMASTQMGGSRGGGVNVQTSTQPVLVVPLNIGQAGPKDSYIPGPSPDAPSTYSIDTSANEQYGGGGGFGGGGYQQPQRSRSRSNSGGSSGGRSQRGGQESGGAGPAPSGPNVKVTVVKQG
jgi:hypothetical protein